jgi:hypothetical protein
MGTPALRSISLAAVVAWSSAAAADTPRTASVAVAPACADVVDHVEVVVALRVELGSIGFGTVDERGGMKSEGSVAVAVECPSPRELVVAMGDRRATIALADVAPNARARVLALAVADQLRPDAAPPAFVEGLPAPPAHRWELGVRIDGVVAQEADAAMIGPLLLRRSGRWRIEVGVGIIALRNANANWNAGASAEVRGGVELLRVGRARLGASAGLLGAITKRPEGATDSDRYALALRGELFGRVPVGSAWSALVGFSVGRAVPGADWFGGLAIGASTDL